MLLFDSSHRCFSLRSPSRSPRPPAAAADDEARRLQRRPGGRGRRRRRHGDPEGRVRPPAEPGREDLQGAEAGVPRGGHARVRSSCKKRDRPQPRRAGPVRDRRRGARRRGHGRGDRRSASTRSRSSTSRATTKKLKDELEKQGLTEEQVREDLRARILSEKIFEEVTKDVKVTDEDDQDVLRGEQGAVQAAGHARGAPHPRRESKAKADRAIHRQLEDGANFAKLAKQNSTTRPPRTRAASSRRRRARRSRRSTRWRSRSRPASSRSRSRRSSAGT